MRIPQFIPRCISFYLFGLILFSPTNSDLFANELDEQELIVYEKEAINLAKEWNGDDIRHSILLFKETSNHWRELGKLKRATFCIREAVKLSILIAEQEDTLPLLNIAIRLDSQINNIDGLVISHILLYRYFNKNKKHKKSSHHLKKATNLAKLSSNTSKAFVLFYEGKNNLDNRKIRIASKLFDDGLLLISEKDNPILFANILLYKGMVSTINGEKPKGISQIKKARIMFAKTKYLRGNALAKNAFGFVYAITGEGQKAIDNYQEANKLIPISIDFEERAKIYSGIASIYRNYGNLKQAARNQKEAVDWFTKAKNNLGILSNLIQLGDLQFLLNNVDESKQTFENAVKLSKTLNSENTSSLLTFYKGKLDLAEGRIDSAILKFKEYKLKNFKAGISIPKIDNHIGNAYEKKGQIDTARNYYELAATNSRKFSDTIQLAEALDNLSRVNKIGGNIDKAYEYSVNCIEITESIATDVNIDNLRKGYFSDNYNRYDLHINLTMEKQSIENDELLKIKGLVASEKSRTRSMRKYLHLAMNNFNADAPSSLVKQEKAYSSQLKHLREELSNLLRNKNSSKTNIEKTRQEKELKENQLQDIKAKLLKSSPIYSAIQKPPEFDYHKFQADILDENTVLLEFFFGKEKSYVWLVSKNETKVFTLKKKDILNNDIKNLLKLITSYENLPNNTVFEHLQKKEELTKNYWSQAKVVSNELFGQFSDEIKDKRLIIVADGELRSLPIDALPIPFRKKTKPFLFENEIVYAPSASMLQLIMTKRSKSIQPQKDFLVFSDSIYDLDDSRMKARNNIRSTNKSISRKTLNESNFSNELSKFKRLKGSKKEIEGIFRTFDKSNSKTYEGFSCNKETFTTETLWNYKVLHFSTHGLYDEENEELSGILLSNYDEKGNKINNLIQLQEIYDLRLATDLVVLGACETAVGDEIKGEGLMNLTNAFLQVGAKSTIATRWKVDDDKTAELMSNLYKIKSEENITFSKALQKAKIKMYKNPNNRFPYFWASFTFHGDFQNKPNLTKKTSYSIYLLVPFLSLLLIGIYFLARKILKRVYLTSNE